MHLRLRVAADLLDMWSKASYEQSSLVAAKSSPLPWAAAVVLDTWHHNVRRTLAERMLVVLAIC